MTNTNTEVLTQVEIDLQEALAKVADLRKAKKELTQKPKRELKGRMIEFKNQAGETIRGMGTLYYVVKFNGKLHYKAADAVTLL